MNTRAFAAVLTWIAIALIVLVVVLSIALPERINPMFRRGAEGEAPSDVAALRARWRTVHYLRTVPAIAAFLALVLAAAWG